MMWYREGKKEQKMGIKELLRRKEIITPETLRSQFGGVKEQVLPLLEEVRREEERATVSIRPFPIKEGGWTTLTFYNTPISSQKDLPIKDLKMFLVPTAQPTVSPLELRSEAQGIIGASITADLVGKLLEEGECKIYASSPKNKWLFSVTYKK